jgi:hypothetical protein
MDNKVMKNFSKSSEPLFPKLNIYLLFYLNGEANGDFLFSDAIQHDALVCYFLARIEAAPFFT